MEDIIEDMMQEVEYIESLQEDSMYREYMEEQGLRIDLEKAKEIIAFYKLHQDCDTSKILKPFIKS